MYIVTIREKGKDKPPIAHECRTKKLGPAKEAEGYGKTGAV